MQASIEDLDGLKRSDIRLSLDPISRFLARLDNPQNAYGSVLIGGTNGKGSIAAMLASVMSRAGYRVGLYTSPHLIDVRERIRVGRVMISQEDFNAWSEVVKSRSSEGLTYFEFLTALAFLYFRSMQVDLAVLEVGMGGRFDATNVVSPLVSAVSNISVDHTEYLGNRVEDIAWEKAGIIRNGALCITAAKDGGAARLEEICDERGATLYRVGKDIRVRMHRDGSFSYRGINVKYDNIVCPLAGRHQLDNAAVALGLVEALALKGFSIGEDAVQIGIHEVKWEGRLEVIRTRPRVILDGAHNVGGASALAHALAKEFSFRKLIFVFGVLRDKDYAGMLRRLLPLGQRLILTRPDTERAMPPEAIVPFAQGHIGRIEVVKDALKALERALSVAGPDDLICVTGSLYLVGEIKKSFPACLS